MRTETPLARARLMASTISEPASTIEPVLDPKLILMASAPKATASSIAFT